METTARGDVPKTLQTIAYISIPNSADLEFLLWDLQDAIAAYAQLSGTALPRPVDLEADDADNVAGGIVLAIEDVADDEMILDVGPKTAQILADYVSKAKTIVWNGPVGVFEMAPYAQGTAELAKAIAQATSDGAFSIAGGGDTVSAVSVFGVADKVSYISTGGGAFLEFLEGKSLPAIAVLQQRAAK